MLKTQICVTRPQCVKKSVKSVVIGRVCIAVLVLSYRNINVGEREAGWDVGGVGLIVLLLLTRDFICTLMSLMLAQLSF